MTVLAVLDVEENWKHGNFPRSDLPKWSEHGSYEYHCNHPRITRWHVWHCASWHPLRTANRDIGERHTNDHMNSHMGTACGTNTAQARFSSTLRAMNVIKFKAPHPQFTAALQQNGSLLWFFTHDCLATPVLVLPTSKNCKKQNKHTTREVLAKGFWCQLPSPPQDIQASQSSQPHVEQQPWCATEQRSACRPTTVVMSIALESFWVDASTGNDQ